MSLTDIANSVSCLYNYNIVRQSCCRLVIDKEQNIQKLYKQQKYTVAKSQAYQCYSLIQLDVIYYLILKIYHLYHVFIIFLAVSLAATISVQIFEIEPDACLFHETAPRAYKNIMKITYIFMKHIMPVSSICLCRHLRHSHHQVYVKLTCCTAY